MRKQLIDFLHSTKKSFRIKKNVLSTDYDKHVLISYNVNHFITKNIAHTNFHEIHIIAKVFSDLKFNIDVVSFDNPRNINFNKYDIVFGFGIPFESSFRFSDSIKRIYYATGAHVCHQNQAEVNRIIEVNRKKNSALRPKRIVTWTFTQSTSMSDAIIVLGNEWVKGTYVRYTDTPIFKLSPTSLFQNISSVKRDISEARKNFIWFGSGGLVHKGLDLCLDFFSKNPQYILHICGPREEDFFEVYAKELASDNVHYHGFVDVQSEKFLQITHECLFVIQPSCSEAQSTAVLTAMSRGLIPIITKENGIDIDNFGIEIEGLSENHLADAMNKTLEFSDDQLSKMANTAIEVCQKNHTLVAFQNSFTDTINEIFI